MAVARIDAQCKLLWVREFGGAQVTVLEGLLVTSLASDASGSVTFDGAFIGNMDLGQGPIAPSLGALAGGFLMRLDPDGNTVFTRVFGAGGNGVLPDSLAVAPDGSIAMLARTGDGPDFGGGPGASYGSTTGGAVVPHLVQFDAKAVFLSDRSLHEGPYLENLVRSLDGTLYARVSVTEGTSSREVLMHQVPSTGDFTGDTDVTSLLLAGAPEGVVVYERAFTNGVAPILRAYHADGSSPWNHQTVAPELPGSTVALRLVVDARGGIVVGGDLSGYTVTDGSFSTTDSPVGAGFQSFDPHGTLLRIGSFGGEHARFHDMTLASDGAVVLVGDIGGPQNETTEVFVAKLRR